MQVFLLEENITSNFLKKIFKIVELKEDKIIINKDCKKMKLSKKIKILNYVNKILKENKSNKIIISKRLKEDNEFLDLLYSCNIDIIQGKLLFKMLIQEVVENICKTNNLKQENTQLAITLNNVNEWSIKLIEDLSKKFKMLNIVTNKINLLKNLQSKLYEENGIIITITNNKKKALINSDLIINVDFPEEMINKYRISDTSIIINLEEIIKIKKKRFNGKIINDYKIRLKEESNIKENLEKEKFKNFDIRDITEVYVINNPKEIEDVLVL